MGRLLNEKNIHLAFDVSLWLKGLFALAETIAGVATYFISKQFLLALVVWVTKDEFAENPQDVVSNFLLHSVQNISISEQHFAGLYLLGHGIIKLWLIIGLLRKKLWYYPAALGVFSLFVIYQLYRYAFTHSVWLLLITLLDLIVIGLAWHEYRYMRRAPRVVI